MSGELSVEPNQPLASARSAPGGLAQTLEPPNFLLAIKVHLLMFTLARPTVLHVFGSEPPTLRNYHLPLSQLVVFLSRNIEIRQLRRGLGKFFLSICPEECTLFWLAVSPTTTQRRPQLIKLSSLICALAPPQTRIQLLAQVYVLQPPQNWR